MNAPFPTDETIAAVATAVATGQGGIAVIRISGPFAKQVGEETVLLSGKQTWDSHKVLYGHVTDEQKVHIDEVLILYMQAPRSFTGEDIVEIHCHGGLIAVNKVLERVLSNSQVRRAYPGEFSQRAVLNGRIDLTQAEAINDLISARSQKAAQLAMAGIDGKVTSHIKHLRERLLDQLSEIEARVDFEDELPLLNEKQVLNELSSIRLALQKLIQDAKIAGNFRNGLKVAFIGRPNVGKSSLLNRLSKQEKAIVTDLPGTTRDLLESEIILEGVPITLIDTAGIRATSDSIERLGISRTQQAVISADVVILIFDRNLGWTKDDQDLLEQIPAEVPKLIIGNKSDLDQKLDDFSIENKLVCDEKNLPISALTGEGEEAFIKELLEVCGTSKTEGLQIALNERQLDLATLAEAAIARTEEVAIQKLPWDFWTIDVRDAIHRLGELTGDEITEATLDRIFSRFCIGK